MSEQALLGTLIQLFTTIDSCIERKVQLPTLMLIYAGIDSVGRLWAEDPDAAAGTRFRSWVGRYLLPAKPLACTADDLWSARCGILHTMTGDSDLIVKGRAKRLAYAWGNADVADLQAFIDRATPGECVAVHIAHLADAFRIGTVRMFEDADTDRALGRRLEERAGRSFLAVTPDLKLGVHPTGLSTPPPTRADGTRSAS